VTFRYSLLRWFRSQRVVLVALESEWQHLLLTFLVYRYRVMNGAVWQRSEVQTGSRRIGLAGMELAGLVEWSLSDNPPPRQDSSATSLSVDPLYLVIDCGTSDPGRQIEVVNR
jgi:hypothetical protein